MTTIDNVFSLKKPKKFFCENCNFKCSYKKDFERHIYTVKHKNNILTTNNNDSGPEIPNLKKYICDFCEKVYNDRAGLWRHKKKCSKPLNMKDLDADKNLIITLLQQNAELQKSIIELSKNNQINTSYNNCNNNNSFNLQFFLNETCKNAMNIMEFVDSIKLQLSDLESVGEMGYVKGISNIILKNLKALDVTKRPIHCSDAKREVLYIKDNDVWEKEEPENNKFRKAIKYISHKNTKLLPLWKEKNPDCQNYNSSKSDKYNYLVIEAMGGMGENYTEKEDKIIKMIAKEVVIEK